MVRIMTEHPILNLKDKAFDLQNKFIKRFDQTWGLHESVEELCIQIGHLCQSFINNKKLNNHAEAFNQNNRILSHIKDELCDCFLSMCSIYKFYDMKEQDLPIHNISTQKTCDELITELFVLSAQLLDSCLILKGTKPAFDRDEKAIFLNRYSAILQILEQISATEKINMEKEFDKMIERTLLFLKGGQNAKSL